MDIAPPPLALWLAGITRSCLDTLEREGACCNVVGLVAGERPLLTLFLTFADGQDRERQLVALARVAGALEVDAVAAVVDSFVAAADSAPGVRPSQNPRASDALVCYLVRRGQAPEIALLPYQRGDAGEIEPGALRPLPSSSAAAFTDALASVLAGATPGDAAEALRQLCDRHHAFVAVDDEEAGRRVGLTGD